jgi:hypothetical protein
MLLFSLSLFSLFFLPRVKFSTNLEKTKKPFTACGRPCDAALFRGRKEKIVVTKPISAENPKSWRSGDNRSQNKRRLRRTGAGGVTKAAGATGRIERTEVLPEDLIVIRESAATLDSS